MYIVLFKKRYLKRYMVIIFLLDLVLNCMVMIIYKYLLLCGIYKRFLLIKWFCLSVVGINDMYICLYNYGKYIILDILNKLIKMFFF